MSQGLALLLLEEEKFEKETGERLGAKYVFQTVCVLMHLYTVSLAANLPDTIYTSLVV